MVLTWTFDSQTSSHNENRPISHFVITNLKIGLMVLTQVRSGLLKIDLKKKIESNQFMKEPKSISQIFKAINRLS
jgi:hypothetical protein